MSRTMSRSTVARAAEEIHLAKISRSIAPGPLREEQSWVAAGMGSLFRRSHALSQAIFLAMLSRGYTGETRLLDDPPWRARDAVFVAGVGAVGAMLVILGNRL